MFAALYYVVEVLSNCAAPPFVQDNKIEQTGEPEGVREREIFYRSQSQKTEASPEIRQRLTDLRKDSPETLRSVELAVERTLQAQKNPMEIQIGGSDLFLPPPQLKLKPIPRNQDALQQLSDDELPSFPGLGELRPDSSHESYRVPSPLLSPSLSEEDGEEFGPIFASGEESSSTPPEAIKPVVSLHLELKEQPRKGRQRSQAREFDSQEWR